MGTADNAPRVYRSSMQRPMGTIRRPQRVDGEQLCLAAYVKINGVKAYTLFDSGSTTDSISPDFTRVAQIPVKTLEDPVTLQLGCVGSRSKINYGTEVDLEFASVTNSTYLDVANLDKYDSILGTPFLRRHGISLDFESQEIVIRGKLRIPALSEGEGTAATVSFPRSMRPTRKITPRNCLDGRSTTTSSTKVEPPRSRRNVTIEEEDDEDFIRQRVKPKLDKSSPHIMEDDSSKDDQPIVDRLDKKSIKKQKNTRSRKKPDREVPVYTGTQYKPPGIPEIRDTLNPTLHSDNYKFRGMTQQQEVLLAAMDAQLNELNKEEQELPDLRAKWVESASDILTGAPPRLPPFREVNHKIPLIDENKRYNYHLPRCPDALKTQLSDKIQRYTKAGWWEETNVPQAAPMLCVLKKSTTPKLRTVIDGRKRNDNTVKDVMPFPDQEEIRNNVARAKYRSKIDMSDAYEQIHVEPDDVWKTAFSTVYGIPCSREIVTPLLHFSG